MTDTGRKLRVLVAIHQLDPGGSQTNAVDLASGVHDRGHEVVVAGPHGPLVEVIRERGLAYEPVELDRMDRAGAGFPQLQAATRRMRPDLLHTYELIPSLLGFAGPHRRDGTPMTMTINSMSVPGFMPGSVPLQVCNPVIAAAVRRRSGSVGVLEIPTDCVTQSPSFPGAGFRSEIGVADDELLVVVVSRFARVLKQEGLETAIAAVGRLAEGRRIRLAMVGDGPAMPDLRALAEQTNERVGRPAVVLTGMRSDPRPAYAAADVVLGMGGSLLRAMAFGKPCIVQGEGGYWRILDEDTAREFRWRGFYGIGAGAPGVGLLTDLLGRLLDDDALRRQNGEFALDLVRQCYSLEHAVDLQIEWYRRALREHRPAATSELVRTAASVGSWVARRAVARVRGTASADTFNSQAQIEPGFRAPVPSSFCPDPVRRTTAIRPEPDIAGWWHRVRDEYDEFARYSGSDRGGTPSDRYRNPPAQVCDGGRRPNDGCATSDDPRRRVALPYLLSRPQEGPEHAQRIPQRDADRGSTARPRRSGMMVTPEPIRCDLNGGPDGSVMRMSPAAVEPVSAPPARVSPAPAPMVHPVATSHRRPATAARGGPVSPDGSAADFEPIQIIRIDLAEPLQAISRQISRSGRCYTRGRVLVLLHGISLGTLWVDLPGERIAVDRLAELVLHELGPEIRSHLLADGAGPAGCEVDVRRLAEGLGRPCASVTEVLPGATASVVLATCGRPTSARLALEALLRSDHPDFEVIVVDNSPEDPRTRRLIAEHFASEPRVRLEPEPQRGLSHARNRGLGSARADIVAFTDDDVVVSPTWLSRLAAEFVPGVACVTGLVEPIELETVSQWWFECAAGFGRGRERRHYHLTDSPDTSPLFPYKLGSYGTGASMALSRRELPGWTFDAALGAGSPAAGGEDLDLFLDVLMNGWSLVYQPAALSFHLHRATVDELEKQMSGYGRGLTGVLSKRLLRRPAERRLLAAKVMAGVRHAIGPQFRTESAQNVPASPYPRSMLAREVLGMAQGPLAYVVGAHRSRRVARAFRPWNDAVRL